MSDSFVQFLNQTIEEARNKEIQIRVGTGRQGKDGKEINKLKFVPVLSIPDQRRVASYFAQKINEFKESLPKNGSEE